MDARSPQSIDRAVDLIQSVRKRGVALWAERGQLRYRAPAAALSGRELDELKTHRAQILALLDGVKGLSPRLRGSAPIEHVPLTYCQQSHWDWHRLSERGHFRQIASAMVLRGRLDIPALEASVAAMLERHEALRTRIALVEGSPVQEIHRTARCDIEIDDLGASAEGGEGRLERALEAAILEPLDVTRDALFKVRLLQLGPEKYLLILAMEHLISDGVSLGILLRDLFTTYTDVLTNRPPSLPPLPLQFADFAVWQQQQEASWLTHHGAYWNDRLAGGQRVMFPIDYGTTGEPGVGWGRVPVRIDRALKCRLREWCRVQRTTMAMTAYATYVVVLLRWCGALETVLQYTSSGRANAGLENTIGFFASFLSLRVSVRNEDRFTDVLNRVTEEYCNAIEHADHGYIESRRPRPPYVRNSAFNWLQRPSAISSFGPDDPERRVTCSSLELDPMMLNFIRWDREPFIMLYESDDEVNGYISFPLDRFSFDTMRKFTHNFVTALHAVLEGASCLVKDVPFTLEA